jgi:hypothetical protein
MDQVDYQINYANSVADAMLNPFLTDYEPVQILLEALGNQGLKIVPDDQGVATAALHRTLVPEEFDPLEGT